MLVQIAWSLDINPKLWVLISPSCEDEEFRARERVLPVVWLSSYTTAEELLYPALWWEQYGDSAPGLQRVAMRILSQVCSTFSLQRHWSFFRQSHSEKRNKIDRETLNDLVYINFNLKLATQMKAKSLEVDPLQFDDIDMNSEWVEESEKCKSNSVARSFWTSLGWE